MNRKCAVCGCEIQKKDYYYVDNRNEERKYLCSDDCLCDYLQAQNATCDYCGSTISDEPPLRDKDNRLFCCYSCLARGNGIDFV